MASPSWFFDGDRLRIYEVPPDSSYVIDGEGYRIYTPNDLQTSESLLYVDIQRDLWSRWVDFHDSAKWSHLAFSRSGGASRGYDQYGQEKFQSVDFNLLASMGWRIVLADYDHELRFFGNIYSDSASELFDYERISSIPPPRPRFEGFADLLTYRMNSGGATAEEVAGAVWQTLIETGYTAAHIMQLLAAASAGKLSGADTGTITIRDLADSLDRITATTDQNGNRLEVNCNVS